MPVEREDAILGIQEMGYTDTQIDPNQSQEAVAISLRLLQGRYPDIKPEEIAAEYQNGVDERRAHVAARSPLEFGEEEELPEVRTVNVSNWQQEFGSEYRTAIGERDGRYYSGVEISEDGGESDMEWGKAHEARQAAEKELAERVNRFTESAGVRETQYQNSQIAGRERPEQIFTEEPTAARDRADSERRQYGKDTETLIAMKEKVMQPEPEAAKQTWLEQESNRIREASETPVPASEVDVANAYWNGRRESYNSARDFAIETNPDRAKDLPDAIQVDQVRVRALLIEQEQEMSVSATR